MKNKIAFIIMFIITFLMLSLFFAAIVSGRRNPEDIIYVIISTVWLESIFLGMFVTSFSPENNK